MGEGRGSKAKILATASALIRDGGYHATSLDDILKDSGVARSNFYYHFDSKEAMTLAVLDAQIAFFQQRIIAPTIGSPNRAPLDRLNAFFDALTDLQRGRGAQRDSPFAHLAVELADEGEPFRERLSAFFRGLEQTVAATLRAGLCAQSFRADLDPDQAAAMIVAYVEGAILLAKTHRSLTPLSQGLPLVSRLLEPPAR